MKWSLFSWKKPAELAPGDYQQVKTNVNNNTTSITNLRTLTTALTRSVSAMEVQMESVVKTNTEQTITGLKTFNAGPIGLKLKQVAGRDDKQYLIFANKNDTTTFSLGSDLSGTNFELNRGHLRIQAKEANKNVYFDNVSTVEFNNATPQFGQNIKAGWGGGVCKFLPEDNSTKTLQFYLNNANDTRRFNLLVPEPTQANNPTTKNYVDTNINATTTILTNTRNTLNEVDIRSVNNENEINNIKSTYATQRYVGGEISGLRLDLTDGQIQKRDYTFPNTNVVPFNDGSFITYLLEITDLQETMVVGYNISYMDQTNSRAKAIFWKNSFSTTWGPKICISLFGSASQYQILGSTLHIDFSKFKVSVFYIPKYTTRQAEKTYQGNIVNLQEVMGGK